MSISYPLSLPTSTRIRSINLTAVNAVAYSQSPFTFAGQAHAYSGQMWRADVTLPPMRRTAADQWITFLMSLRGQYGTFLLGDPIACTPRGLASAFLGVPIITSQTGGTITVTGASTDKSNWLLAGDYIQIGTGSDATLHKVLQNASTDGSGGTTLEIWPHVRGTRSGSITVSSAVGNFRLSENQQSWSVNEASVYGINFSAMEAI